MSVQKIHLANLLTNGSKKGIESRFPLIYEGKIFSLETFYNENKVTKLLSAHPEIKILLDSGAYSLVTNAIKLGQKKREDGKNNQDNTRVIQKQDFRSIADWSYYDTQEVKNFIKRYVEFVNKYKNQLDVYVNIDVIFNPERTWDNQKLLESYGLKPMPVYHFGEDIKWLKKYMDNYEYIGIGGLGQDVTKNRFVLEHGDPIFSLIQNSKQKIRTHGFAITSVDLMLRYAWNSCDSTTWIKHAAYGGIYVPKFKKDGKTLDYSKTPLSLTLSTKSKYNPGNPHFTKIFPEEVIKQVLYYLEMKGFKLEDLEESWERRWDANIAYFVDVGEFMRSVPVKKLSIQKRFF